MAILDKRIIGSHTEGNPGPLLFLIGGIHGNEPAGVRALERVTKVLEEIRPPFKGKFFGLRGNCAALAEKKRYIDRDLNRLWSENELARVKALAPEDRNSEERELIELVRYLEAALKSEYNPLIFVDMHTTSAPGGPFSIVTDDVRNRDLAEALHAPIIFNLVNELALTTNKFFENRGLNGIAFESGQHDDPLSIDVHEAAIWVMLAKIGCLQADDIPDFYIYPERLKKASAALSPYLRVSYRHDVSPEDEFQMYPGYVNFQPIKAGEPLAKDRNHEIKAPIGGQMLMPLYQKQGEDGFFVIEEITEPPV